MSPRKKAKKEGRPVRGKSKPKQQNGGQSGEAGEEVAAILLPTDELLGPDAEGDAAVIQQAALDALNALFAGQDALDAAAAPEEEELPAPQPPEPTSGGRRDGTTAPTAPDTLGAVAAAPRVFGTAEVQAVVQGRRDVQPPNTTNAYESRLKKHLQPVCDLYKKDMGKIWGQELAQLGTVAIGNMGKQGYAASTIRNLSSAIRWLCWENRYKQGISCDFKNAGDYELFRQANKWSQRVIKGQGPRRQGDPQASTAADTYTTEEYQRISELLVQGQAAASKLRMPLLGVAQTQALFHIMHFGAGRGDDTRVMMLADIAKPRSVDVLSGVAPCWMVPIVLYGTKTQRNDKPNYIALVRAKDSLRCPVRALAELLFVRFTLLGEEFPDLRKEDAWLSAPLLRKEDGRGTATPMDYDTMATLVKKVLDTLGINVCKVTHCMRVAGAQYLESQGVPLQTIERWGRWCCSTSVVDAYLTNAPPDAVAGMGGYGYCQGEALKTVYFAPRFKVLMPPELLNPLILRLMPKLPELREQAKEVVGTDPARMSAINFPDALEYLMSVLVQDSLELADRAPNNPVVLFLQKHAEWQTLRGRYLACREELDRCKPPTAMEAISHQSRQNAQLSRQLTEQRQMLLQLLAQQAQAGQMAPPLAAGQQGQAGWSGVQPLLQPQQQQQQLAPPLAVAQQGQAGWSGVQPLLQQQQQQLAPPLAVGQQGQAGWSGVQPLLQPQLEQLLAAVQQGQAGWSGGQPLLQHLAQVLPAAQQGQAGWPGGPSVAHVPLCTVVQPAQAASPTFPRSLPAATTATATTEGMDPVWSSPCGQHRRAAATVAEIMAGRTPLPANTGGVVAGSARDVELQMCSPMTRHRRADEVVAATMQGRAAPPLGTGVAVAGSEAAGGSAMPAAAQKKKKRGAVAVAASAAAAQPSEPCSVLWKWSIPELSFMLDGAFPFRKGALKTVTDLYGAYYAGCPTDCAGRTPPWIDLFNKYGPKDDRNGLASTEATSWYPGKAVAKQLTQRMWEFRSLHRWCMVITAEHRGQGLKEAAEFWAGKTKQTLKPFWEDVIQYLVEEPALFREVVAVSPSLADWRQRLHEVLPADLGAAFKTASNAAGSAAGNGAAAGGVGEDEPAVTQAKNVLFLWLKSKAAEPGQAMTLSERMEGWFAMTYAERNKWKEQHKNMRC